MDLTQHSVSPLFLLAPGPCFSNRIATMLGQHPQMLAMPETGLLTRDSMSEWLEQFGSTVTSKQLLRSSARILSGEQTPRAMGAARRWLQRQYKRHTADVLAELAMHALPRLLVDTATMVSYRPEHMERVRSAFPQARFVHLVRHPVGYGNSLLTLWEIQRRARGPRQVARLVDDPESIFFRLFDSFDPQPVCDPQESWYVRQSTVAAFVATLEPSHCLTVKVEDLLGDTLQSLRHICQWLQLRDDPEAIGEMLQPQRPAPAGISIGSQDTLTADHLLTGLDHDSSASLQDEVPWLGDGRGFSDKVKSLANKLSYY